MLPIHTYLPSVVLAGICFASSSSQASAGTKVIVGRVVSAAQRISMDEIDHSIWDGLLQKYVDDVGNVDYRGWTKSRKDVGVLNHYLNELSRADASTRASREGYLAFWINAYNAVTIKGILREYPTTSIRNHTAKLYGYNIWYDLVLAVGDTHISLNDIEHKVLRKTGEPRIHFAIVCASQSCPRLLSEAYTKEKVEQQLELNTRNFFANREHFRYQNERFYLSPILKWFADDFGSSQSEMLRSIAPYLPDSKSIQAARRGVGKISYLRYDWSLNDQGANHTARRQ